MRTLTALVVLALALPVAAQETDRAWQVAERGALDATTVVLDVPPSSDGAPTRVRLYGTLDSTIDGAELDAASLRHAGVADLAIGAPLVLSPGAEIVEADASGHRYVIEAPPGTPIHATLAISRLAASHLVTARELRDSLQGSIAVEVLRRTPAPPLATAVLAETSDGGGALALGSLLAVIAAAFFVRREPEEARLVRRAQRAASAIAARARTLGPASLGLIAPAERLLAAVRRARAHLATLDAAIAATRDLTSEAARTHKQCLVDRRAAVRADLERMTGELEAALVRLASLETERHAETQSELVASRMRAEVEIAEDVERELADL